MNNLTMEYETEVKNIEFLIYNLGNIGFDCTNLVDTLNKIKEETNSSLDNIRNNKEIGIPAKHMLLDGAYRESLGKLRNLEFSIKENEKYYNMIKELMSINNLMENEIDISLCVEKLINLIKIAKSLNIDELDNKDVFNTLYQTVYNVIKLEIKTTGNSKLLDYCDDYKIDSVYLNSLVLEDIEKLKEKEVDMTEINEILNSLSLGDYYLDKKLIRLIVFSLYDDNYMKKIEEKLAKIRARSVENYSSINNVTNQIQRLSNQKKEVRKNFPKSKIQNIKITLKNLFPIIISGGIIFSALKLIPEVKEKSYMTKTTTYTSSDDSYEVENSYKPKIFRNDDVIIQVHHPYKKERLFDTQKVLEYAYVEDMHLEELSTYLTLVENNIIKLKSSLTAQYFLEDNDKVTETTAEVIKKDVDYDNYIMTDNEALQDLLYTLLGCYILLYEIGGFCVFIRYHDYSFNYGSIQSIFKLIHELKDNDLSINKEKLEKVKQELELAKQELNELLNGNKELAKEYKEYMSLHGKKFDSSLEETSSMGMVRRLGK